MPFDAITPPTAGDVVRASFGSTVAANFDDHETRIVDLEAVTVGSGDVVGPASATDNAIVRFDTTTGKLVQTSGITLADGATGTLSGTNTGDVTLAGAGGYLSLVGQVLTRALIDLTAHVTGRLPWANVVTVTGNRLIGRISSTGDVQEIPIGSGLALDGSGLRVTAAGGGVPALDDLTDVAITAPVTDHVVTYDGSGWVNGSLPNHSAALLTSGAVPDARMPALTGDVTTSAGAVATTIASDAVTYAKMQNVSAASKLIGRGDAGSGDPQEITLGSGLTMTGTTLAASGGGGGGAPTDATYVTLGTDGTLTSERVLTGTANQITVTDGGAGSTVTLSTPQGIATSSTPQFLRMGLGMAADGAAALIVSGQYASAEFDAGNSGTAKTINWNDGNQQTLTLTGTVTLTLSNPLAGGRYLLILAQDGTGSRTVTWPAAVKWPGGTAPTLSTAAGAIDIVTLARSTAGGGIYIANANTAFS